MLLSVLFIETARGSKLYLNTAVLKFERTLSV